MVLVAVRRQTLRHEAIRILCRYIVDTPLRDGDPLPSQRDLAVFLQVSRTVIREALSSLEARGIIEIRASTRALVRNARAAADDAATDDDETTEATGSQELPTQDLFEFRAAIYMGLPELMCQRATAEDIRNLRALLERMDKKLGQGRTILGEVQEFSWKLTALTRNRLVLGLRSLDDEADRRGLLIQSSILGKPTQQARDHLQNHRRMVDAIEARDPDSLRILFRTEYLEPVLRGSYVTGTEGQPRTTTR